MVMKDEYDFSKGIKNPYTDEVKARTTIRLDKDTIVYFKKLAEQKGIPYQTLINLFLRHCAEQKLVPDVEWKKQA
jgi:predicted DNA binding CopG/RHH family protein